MDVRDLIRVILEFGATGAAATPGDANLDGVVNMADLLEVIATWGPCS